MITLVLALALVHTMPHHTFMTLSKQPMGAGQTLLSSSEVIFAHSFRVSE